MTTFCEFSLFFLFYVYVYDNISKKILEAMYSPWSIWCPYLNTIIYIFMSFLIFTFSNKCYATLPDNSFSFAFKVKNF